MIDFKNSSIIKLSSNPEYSEKVKHLIVRGENIIASFKDIRDGVVFTNKRIIAVNVKGVTGRKTDYTSIPYKSISTYSIETAGILDLDGELEVYVSPIGKIKFEFSGGADIKVIEKAISESIFQ